MEKQSELSKSKLKRIDCKDALRNCFTTLIDRKKLVLDISATKSILQKNLHVSSDIIKDGVTVNVLAELLVYYMKIWPGWSRSVDYFTGKLSFKDWYETFHQYLIFQMHNVIKNEPVYREEALKDKEIKSVGLTDKQINTIKFQQSIKPDAPYVLHISGPPVLLSNIIFAQQEKNLVMKTHDSITWQNLKTKELLNWPCVTVQIRFQDISITRKNCHEFSRYISLSGDVNQCPEADLISYVKATEQNLVHQSYTVKYLELYMQQFVEVFSQIKGIINDRLVDLGEIFEQFLADINESNVYNNTVCTHTSVCYNIGKMKYIRNKKLLKNSNHSETKGINFNEIIIPKVEYTLEHFKDSQDTAAPHPSFVQLNMIASQINTLSSEEINKITQFVNENCITYRCNFCDLHFCSIAAKVKLVKHLLTEHSFEQPVLCFKCKNEFDVISLAGNRWSHVCTS